MVDGNSDSAFIGPGSQLKSLRETKGFSLQDVFERTRIPLSKLRQLESEAFHELGASVYVFGYVRAYAKALSVDAEPLIELFQQAYENQAELVLSSESYIESGLVSSDLSSRGIIARTPSNSSSKTPFFAAIAIIFLCLAVGLVLYAKDKKPDNHDRPSSVGAKSEILSIEEDADTEFTNQAESSSERDMADRIEVLNRVHQGTQQLDPSSDLSTQATKDELLNSTLPSPDNSDLGSLSEEPSSDGVMEEDFSKLDVPGTLDDAPESRDAELRMSFIGDCWVEIRDRNNEIVFADLQNSGDNLRLFGLAPFNIMFGNVRAVDLLSIDNEQVELNIRDTRKTLRLTVDRP